MFEVQFWTHAYKSLFNSNQTLPLEISMSINIIRAAYFRGLLTLHDFKN